MHTAKAIRELRTHVGASQQAFSTSCGLSITALQNYEKDRVPEPKQLLALIARAEAEKRRDIADVLRRELRSTLGADPDKRLTI